MGHYHPIDGISNPKYKLLHFLTRNFLAKWRRHQLIHYNQDRCCLLALCLWLILLHYFKMLGLTKSKCKQIGKKTVRHLIENYGICHISIMELHIFQTHVKENNHLKLPLLSNFQKCSTCKLCSCCDESFDHKMPLGIFGIPTMIHIFQSTLYNTILSFTISFTTKLMRYQNGTKKLIIKQNNT